MQFSGLLVKVPQLVCRFLTERQKFSLVISRHRLACSSVPKSKDYAHELVDGQESRLASTNVASLADWGECVGPTTKRHS